MSGVVFVLIMVLDLGKGGSVATAQFTSQGACENAAIAFTALVEGKPYRVGIARAVCVAQGDGNRGVSP